MADTIKGLAVVQHSSQSTLDLRSYIPCREELFSQGKIKKALYICHKESFNGVRAEMKINPYCILPLLVLLAASKEIQANTFQDSSSEDQSSSEERDDFMEYLVTNFEDIFPSVLRPTCEKKSTERTEENMEKAAKNVFKVLLTDLGHPSEFTFESLIVGAACGTSHRPETILHMKVKRTVTRKCPLAHTLLSPFCKSNEKRNVYCSWIGTLENEVPQKTLGAACYQSGKVSVRDEKILGVTDICSELKYGSTQLHRLLIPEQVSSWNANFFFYYPPTADPQGHQALADLGEKVPKKFLNPDGRKGIAGQGFMKKLGKNKVEIPVILRYHKGMTQVLIAGQRDKREMEGPLAMFYQKTTESNELCEWEGPSAGEYFYSLLDTRNETKCSKKKFQKMMKPKTRIYEGYLPNPYETDNAWISVVIYVITASEESCLSNLNLNRTENYLRLHWKSYNSSTLRSVQGIVNTFFKAKESTKITAAGHRTVRNYLFYFTTATALACAALFAAATSAPLLILPTVIMILAGLLRLFNFILPASNHVSSAEKVAKNMRLGDTSSDGQSSSEEKDDLMKDLARNVEDIIPSRPRPACEKQSTRWNEEKKEKAARNVFNTLLLALERSSEFSFEKLIVGTKCGDSEQSETILHMKINRTVTKKCPMVSVLTPLNKVLIHKRMIKYRFSTLACIIEATSQAFIVVALMPSSIYHSIPLDVVCKLVQLNFNTALLRSFSLTGKMECQVDKMEHLRHVLLFLSNGRLNALAEAEKVQAVYEEKAISDRLARKEGNFDLSDSVRSERPRDFDEGKLNALVHENPRQSTREPAEKIGCSHMTVSRHLLSVGKRVSVAGSLLARYRQAVAQRRPFFNQIITGDEKWCLYVNMKQRKEWLSPGKDPTPRAKPKLHERKTMLSLWWDFEDVIHFELLPKNQAITATIYVEQLRRLGSAVQQKRQKKQHAIKLQHDNARPHTAIITKSAIQELVWEAHTLLSPFCKSNEKRNVYCSWIGTLENEVPQKTLGAACYLSGKISVKKRPSLLQDEKMLGVTDVCTESKFGNTQLHRLLIPEQVSSWNANFFFYYPPTADPQGRQALADPGEKAAKKFLNPGGRKGIAGQGIFKKLGENKVEIPVILRFIFCSLIHYLTFMYLFGNCKHHNGTRQVLIAGRPDKWGMQGPLPMFYRKPTSSNELHEWKEPSAGEYFYSLLDSHDQARCSKEIFLKMMSPKSKIFKGHIPHPYETDNAWFTVRIHLIKAWNTSCLNELNLNAEQNYMHFRWKTYDNFQGAYSPPL
ncbi:hypothetical protein M513_13515 [Trichuris suis]|uniref:Transposase n=1 Tax=Trichuris suis TaxID=68888 RepID=A0A085LKW4_9BILA|nr:hypothetical protein M513_13515 [Trichuris suis]